MKNPQFVTSKKGQKRNLVPKSGSNYVSFALKSEVFAVFVPFFGTNCIFLSLERSRDDLYGRRFYLEQVRNRHRQGIWSVIVPVFPLDRKREHILHEQIVLF